MQKIKAHETKYIGTYKNNKDSIRNKGHPIKIATIEQ